MRSCQIHINMYTCCFGLFSFSIQSIQHFIYMWLYSQRFSFKQIYWMTNRIYTYMISIDRLIKVLKYSMVYCDSHRTSRKNETIIYYKLNWGSGQSWWINNAKQLEIKNFEKERGVVGADRVLLWGQHVNIQTKWNHAIPMAATNKPTRDTITNTHIRTCVCVRIYIYSDFLNLSRLNAKFPYLNSKFEFTHCRCWCFWCIVSVCVFIYIYIYIYEIDTYFIWASISSSFLN